MKDNVWVKTLASLLLVAGLLFVGFIGMFITLFAGGLKFYTPLVIVITGALSVFVVLRIFEFVKPKLLILSLLLLFL
jgi:phosphate transport system substrate-binding protein